jgi:deoxyribodipyrimidine photo-lyase
MLQIVWFKRDLRVHDHEPLYLAAQHGPVLPLYIVEPALWRQPDASGRQWGFVREALQSLHGDLTALGQPLVVRTGEATGVLRALLRAQPVGAVWSHMETGNAWTFDRDRWSRQWEALMNAPQYPTPRLAPLRGIESGRGWQPGRPARPAGRSSTPACAHWITAAGSTSACARC